MLKLMQPGEALVLFLSKGICENDLVWNVPQGTWIIFLIWAGITETSWADDSLMRREGGGPFFHIDRNSVFYQTHIANAVVLPPDEYCKDLWRVYIRGSAHFPSASTNEDQYHDTIGLFVQSTNSFAPDGVWKEYDRQPLLKYDPPGSCDEKHLLDCSPVVGKDGAVYLYYSAVDYAGHHSLAGAESHDGGFSFTKFKNNPLKRGVGPNDAVYHNGLYYIFYGDAKYDSGRANPTSAG